MNHWTREPTSGTALGYSPTETMLSVGEQSKHWEKACRPVEVIVPALIAALNDYDERVRRSAADALGKIVCPAQLLSPY